MASFRSGPGAPGWSVDARSRNFEASTSQDMGLRGVKEAGVSRERVRTVPQPRMPSRLPQSQFQRRPSDSQLEQPQIRYQPQTRNSIYGSESSGVPTPNPPGSSSSQISKLPTPALRRRNILRRKLSGLSQEPTSNRNHSRDGSRDYSYRTGSSSSSSIPRSQTSMDASAGQQFDRTLTESPMDLRAGSRADAQNAMEQSVTIYPELDRYRDIRPPTHTKASSYEIPYRLATHDLPPPTPLFSGTSSQISGFSGSPSTRFSASPGPGPYSRDTTPTSMSSQSPGLVAPKRIPASVARMRQLDHPQTRPPVCRRRAGSIPNEADSVSADGPQGLASVRESLTSSSSNSTVRDVERKEPRKETKKQKRLSPLPPSPPPRKSSQKFKKNRDEHESPSKPISGTSAQPAMTTPSPAKAASSSRPRATHTANPSVSGKATAPVRPSRDGTPDLQSQLGLPMPVIHSNLSMPLSSDKRKSGLMAPAPINRPVITSSVPDRTNQQSRLPIGREATPAPRPAVPREGIPVSRPEPGRTTRTPSPSVVTFKTRFPLFGRRPKALPEVPQPEKNDKTTRKGPAAGTGHEGYGRLGHIRRKSSSVTNSARAIPGTMSSQESLNKNNPSYDQFFIDRMAPVVIAGGEVIENRNTSSELSRTESNQSLNFRRPSVESRNSSQVSLASRDAPRNTLWPSPFPRGAIAASSLGSRRPSESSEAEAPVMQSSLALRRSMQRLQSGETEEPRVPKPIVTRADVVSPSMTSLDTSIMTDDSGLDHPTETTRVGKQLASLSGPKRLIKRARSPRKWNIFGRSQNQPATEEKTPNTSQTVAATVKVVQAKPVAFYTLMDSSEQDETDTPDLEEVLREARNAVDLTSETDTPREAPTVTAQDPAPNMKLMEDDSQPQQPWRPEPTGYFDYTGPSISLDPFTPAPLPVFASDVQLPSQGSGRPSRLPQVGRIPKVVSARAEQISPKSFSRPFHRLSFQAPPMQIDLHNAAFVAKGPSPPRPSSPVDTGRAKKSESGISASPLIGALSDERASVANPSGYEFLSFSPRKNSQCTTTTASSSSGGFTYADATAVVPLPNAPLAEDEIWDEYNDLLGEDTLKVPSSAGLTAGESSNLASHISEVAQQVQPPLESPTFNQYLPSSMDQAATATRVPITSSIYSTDTIEQVQQSLESDPASAVTLFEQTSADEGDEKMPFGRQTAKHTGHGLQQKPLFGRQVRRSYASGSSQASEDNSPLAQVNLRVGSMTVSKWLTFGHVLFSPVRDELISEEGSLKRPSILVIDGLGNDDWSFYAAETYPEATFFNLSPRAPVSDDRRNSSGFPLSPPNHHQVQYLSHAKKFPFGAQSFTAVVYRFPAAAPESHYRNIMAEARRVLKPGGFIELSILDVDLNNMGNRGRRTIRRLKERIHARAPDVSLGSASDLMLRFLGRKGFVDIKSCRVGVPIGNVITRSSGSEGGNGGRRGSQLGVATMNKPKKDERSLPEMMNDESPVADESITKMVAKVGRWWYSRCYESAATGTHDSTHMPGLWSDKSLLTECEEWGTSLKLMVCYARAPDGIFRVASI